MWNIKMSLEHIFCLQSARRTCICGNVCMNLYFHRGKVSSSSWSMSQTYEKKSWEFVEKLISCENEDFLHSNHTTVFFFLFSLPYISAFAYCLHAWVDSVFHTEVATASKIRCCLTDIFLAYLSTFAQHLHSELDSIAHPERDTALLGQLKPSN